MESRFFEAQKEPKTDSRNHGVREIGDKVKLNVRGLGNDFWFDFISGKIDGSMKNLWFDEKSMVRENEGCCVCLI